MLGHIVSTENFKESVKNPGISGLATSFFLVQLSNSRERAPKAAPFLSLYQDEEKKNCNLPAVSV